ncbi:MAG: ribonuclease III [Patescibacteria group bacterium]
MKNLPNLFINNSLFDQALTHRSWVNEHKGKRTSNERLEFLGDAVLEFIVSRELYKSFPDKEEGYLTALRANLVNTISLAEIAKNLNLGSIIYLSKGEEETGGRTNLSLLADTVEAIIGALFIDGGLSSAEEFINKNLLHELGKRALLPLKDAKSLLQEYVQSRGLLTPKYKVIREIGPDHNKEFEIEAVVDSKAWGRGVGKSKAVAEQEAAKVALDMIQSSDGEN